MEKIPKTFNARFSKEIFWALADLIGAKYGRDKTEAVERAILEARDRVMGVKSNYAYPEMGRGLQDVVEVQRQVNAVQEVVAGHIEATATVPERDRGFPVQCRHCRQRGQGATKYATICFGCKGDGHSNDPAECPVCTMMGTGAL